VKAKHIPGIYNYCDRWCERCTLSSRCNNYTVDATPEQKDGSRKALWNKVGQNFQAAARILHEVSKENGIDFNNVSAEEIETYNRKREMARQTALGHPLSTATLQYITKARQLLENKELMKNKAATILQHVQIGIDSEEEAIAETESIKDSQEIIAWYLHFIHVKIMRALMGKMEYDEWQELNGFPKDSDGSAKIALIGIDRSIEAWTVMLEQVPAAEDQILYLLALLQRSRRMGENEFPNARNFIRPGFDQ
jgi:hypothetical protein